MLEALAILDGELNIAIHIRNWVEADAVAAMVDGLVSPRKHERTHVGCAIDVTPGGKLRLRFRAHLPGKGVHRFGETTEFAATPENWRRRQAYAFLIGVEIRNGEFDYLAPLALPWTPRDPRLVSA